MGRVLGLIVEANTQKGREDRDQSLLTVANNLSVAKALVNHVFRVASITCSQPRLPAIELGLVRISGFQKGNCSVRQEPFGRDPHKESTTLLHQIATCMLPNELSRDVAMILQRFFGAAIVEVP